MKNGPIIFIDDDSDEIAILQEVLDNLEIQNELIHFAEGEVAIAYLKATSVQPFFILCDVNMPKLNGIRLRKRIEQDEDIKRKRIPFIFFTTTATPPAIKEAYEMSVQGFFEKPAALPDYERLFKIIYEYWLECRHPNN